MSISRVKIPLHSTPKNIYDDFEHSIPLPDGVGVQIIYKIDGEYYVIAGPRSHGKVMAVNGGAINPQVNFFDQMAKRLHEDTFGLLLLQPSSEKFFEIRLKSGEQIPVVYDPSLTTIEVNKADFYTYVTFCMTCTALSLEQLQEIANKLSPEAMFWHQIGSYLRAECAKAEQLSDFMGEYWMRPEKIAERESIIDAWLDEYETQSAKRPFLLDPVAVLKRSSLRKGLERINKFESFYDLKAFIKHIIGKYSQRSGYHVIKLKDLAKSAKQPDLGVVNVEGEIIGKGVYYPDVVRSTFDRLTKKDALHKAIIVSQISLFSANMNSGLHGDGFDFSINALRRLQ